MIIKTHNIWQNPLFSPTDMAGPLTNTDPGAHYSASPKVITHQMQYKYSTIICCQIYI